MLSRVCSAAVNGIEAFTVEVEVNCGYGDTFVALVGLPGTLSFCSQELLIHGTLTSHPLTGLLLPIATAINAVSIFRLFTRLFLGKCRTGFTIVADALPRGEAMGRIAVAGTTGNPESRRRIAAFAAGKPYPVLVKGLGQALVFLEYTFQEK